MPTSKTKADDVEASVPEGEKPKRVRKPALVKAGAKQRGEERQAEEPVSKEPRRRSASAKAGATAKVPAVSRRSANISVSIEDISVRAYFIAENRRALGLSGDSQSDWLEAERQLRAEMAGIAASLNLS